ncbi:MAG: cytochrome c oxidase subunit II [Thermodesulfovibrio sp.]|nr:cytochrome c oxidase subunit II [Thermodesulfovibrio sp.]
MINRVRSLAIHSSIIFLFILGGFPSSIYSVENRPYTEQVLSGELKNGIREIEVGAYKYGFYPNPIVVKYGEKVKLLMTAMDVPHGIHVPEFKVNQPLPKGVTKTIDFTASQKGQFMVHCSVYCGPNHGKQKTRLIVR